MENSPHVCLACGRPSKEIPLIQLEYQGNMFWICPQHLPTLIHKPEQLAGKLPGAESFDGAGHNH